MPAGDRSVAVRTGAQAPFRGACQVRQDRERFGETDAERLRSEIRALDLSEQFLQRSDLRLPSARPPRSELTERTPHSQSAKEYPSLVLSICCVLAICGSVCLAVAGDLVCNAPILFREGI